MYNSVSIIIPNYNKFLFIGDTLDSIIGQSSDKWEVILVDDVLFTGRTIRAGLDTMLAFGRPKMVELLVLINRRYERHLPIQADYIGKNVHTIVSERAKVTWAATDGEDKVILYTPEDNE